MARRTKENAEATRNALLDAAECVFHEKGVARSSLNDIAQAAGASRGAIYWHFKDKLDLFFAMMDRVTLPLEAAIHPPGKTTSEPDALRRIHKSIGHVLRSVVHDPHTRRVFEIAMYRVEYVNELDSARERHLQALHRFRTQLAQDLELAAQQADICLPTDPMTAAQGLQALFDGLLQAWILGNGTFDLLVTSTTAVNTYLRGLGLRPPSPDVP